jgi:tetratricopeptide (TPR) repeat protein
MIEITINDALKCGVAAHKAGKLQEADLYYTAVLKKVPNHPDANHNIGLLALSVGEIEKAISFFEKALSASPNIAQFWISLCNTLISQKKFDAVMGLLKKAKQSQLDNQSLLKLCEKSFKAIKQPEALFLENLIFFSIVLRENEKYDEAIQTVKIGLQSFPRNSDLYALLSHCYILKNDIAEALRNHKISKGLNSKNHIAEWNEVRILIKKKNFKKALCRAKLAYKRNPHDISGMSLLGVCYISNGKRKVGIEHLNKALIKNPTSFEALISRGIANLSFGDSNTAYKDLKLANQLRPNHTEVLRFLAPILMQKKDFMEANEMFINLCSKEPKVEEHFMSAGICNEELGRPLDALKLFTKASTINPKYFKAYYYTGLTYQKLCKYNQAIESYEQALTIEPNQVDCHNNLGVCLHEIGYNEKAIDKFKTALNLDPGYFRAYYCLGLAYQKMDNDSLAIENYKNALDLKNDFSQAHNNLGICLQKTGNPISALEHFNKAMDINPNYYSCLENLTLLEIQMLSFNQQKMIAQYSLTAEQKKYMRSRSPKFLIVSAICNLIQRNKNDILSLLEDFQKLKPTLINSLDKKDQIFCSAYFGFISKLIEYEDTAYPQSKKKIYHLGDSHCLSFANKNLKLEGVPYRIVPSIIIGAKAFHFSTTVRKNYQALTYLNLSSLPSNSKVFLSFGEIDCRPGEGFIKAANEKQIKIETLIQRTVTDFVDWFLQKNKELNHQIYFFNLPAPVFNHNLSTRKNLLVKETINNFNKYLSRTVKPASADLVDIYRETVGENGFSNEIFHVDRYHIGPKILCKIEKQVNA